WLRFDHPSTAAAESGGAVMRRTMKVVVLIGLSGIAMTACSSGTSSQPAVSTSTTHSPIASTTTTISTAAAGAAHEAFVAPANAALGTFSAKASSWTSSTTNAQAEADAL